MAAPTTTDDRTNDDEELTVLAYDYPLLGLFWTMLWWFFWIAWIVLLFRVIGDIFRSRDMGGWGKALWSIFVIVAPWLGVLDLPHRPRRVDGRTRPPPGAGPERRFPVLRPGRGRQRRRNGRRAGQAGHLRDQGVLTDAEFAQQKAKLLA